MLEKKTDIIRKRIPNFVFLLFLTWIFFGQSFALCKDYSYGSSDPSDLQQGAKYNYYLGQYYYTQGKFNDAQQYFQKSRDYIQRRNTVLAEQQKPALPAVAPVAGNTRVEYTVSEGDTLYITVWQNDDLNQEVIVRPDGKISFPLVGDVPILGLNLTQATDELTRRLKEFIKSPHVSISIRKLGGSKVIMLGEIRTPGVYAVGGNKTILEAIALAGGFTNDAVANSVVLVRGGFAKPYAKRLDLKKAMRGVKFSDNIQLESEDIIFVPKTFISDLSYVLNEIIDPVSRGAFAADVMQKWHR